MLFACLHCSLSELPPIPSSPACKRRPRLSLTHNKHMSLFPSVSFSPPLSQLALHLSWALFNFTICVNVIKISFVKAPKSPPGQGESHSVALVDHRERELLLLLPLPDTQSATLHALLHIVQWQKPKQRSRESEYPER